MLDDSFGFLIPQGELRTHAAWIEWAENEQRSAWLGETARSSWSFVSWFWLLVESHLALVVEEQLFGRGRQRHGAGPIRMGLARTPTQPTSAQHGDHLTLAPTVAVPSPRPFRTGSVVLQKGYSTGGDMVNSSIKSASNAASRLACTMPRVGSRAALAALALEQRQEAEVAPKRIDRQNSVERAAPHVSSSPAPSGGVMLTEAIGSLTAAVPSKGAAGLRIDAFIDAIDRGTLHVLRALGPCALLAVKNGVDNLAKIRTAVEAAAAAGVKCTYVHELLDFEVSRGAHKLGTAPDGSGAVLGNPSGAIAVLWIRRLLQFSAAVLQRVLEGSAIDVAMEQAYGDMLRPSMGNAPPGQCPSLAPAPPHGAPGGSGRRGPPRRRP